MKQGARESRDSLARVRKVVEAALETAALTPELRSFVTDILSQPGRVLAPGGMNIWPRAVLAVASALRENGDAAMQAAAAVELAVAAIDVADELIDHEWQGDAKSQARATNASVALAFLAQRCAADLALHVGPERAMLIAQLIAEGSLGSCAGQDLDVLFEGDRILDEAAYAMTVRKSGSLVGMAFRVGAAVATADGAIVEAAGALGTHIGTVAQLLNDLQDVGSDPRRRKGDLRNGKRTLPIAFAVRCAQELELAEMLDQLDHPSLTTRQEEELLERMHELGAQQYTWTVAEAHRQEALAALRTFRRVTGTSNSASLRTLIPRVAA